MLTLLCAYPGIILRNLMMLFKTENHKLLLITKLPRWDQINLDVWACLHGFFLKNKITMTQLKKYLFNFLKITLDFLSCFNFLFHNKINKIPVFLSSINGIIWKEFTTFLKTVTAVAIYPAPDFVCWSRILYIKKLVANGCLPLHIFYLYASPSC